jgi:hypothetical protein
MTTVDTDWGVGVIFPNRSQELWNGQGNGFEYYQANRNALMNVISVEQYIQLIQSI